MLGTSDMSLSGLTIPVLAGQITLTQNVSQLRFKKSLNQHEVRTPVQFKQPSVGQSREGTAEGLNLQVEIYCCLVTKALVRSRN